MALRTATHRLGQQVVVCLAGDVDAVNADELIAYLCLLLGEQERPRIVANLAALGFIDSAGLTALIEIRFQAQRRGGDLRLAAVAPQIARVLRAARLDQALAIYPTVDDALFGQARGRTGQA